MAQANYQACEKFVRGVEGGNTDTPGDPGGRTGRGGITWRVYDSYRDRKRLPRQDVFLISNNEISEIYKEDYWDPIYGDRLPAGQDLVLFDASINSGPAKANEFRVMAGDGDVPTLINKICAERLSFLQSLGTWRQFGRVWGERVAKCEALALRMAGSLTPAVPAAATQAKANQQKKVTQAIVAGAAAVGSAHHFAGAGKMVILIIVSTAMIAALIAAFKAWRHGQRADALTAAVQELEAAQAAAAKAAAMAVAQLAAQQKTVAAEQAALDAAKTAISQAIPTTVAPVPAVAPPQPDATLPAPAPSRPSPQVSLTKH